MLGDLSGRTALVTGAASGGMGAVISAVLARQGANVAVTDIQVGRTAEVAESLVGGEGMPLALDVSSYESAQGAVAAVEKKWGHLDILVNNAGVGPPLHDDDTFRDDEWDIPFEVNLKGAARCAAAAMPGMKRRRYGKIVNIASIAGHAARGAAGGYGVSKAALLRYTTGLAVEVAPFSINVNAVCPGAVWTGLQRASFDAPGATQEAETPYDSFVESYRPMIPLDRVQSAEDVGKAVAFLVSDDAANITGQCVHVDGGMIRG